MSGTGISLIGRHFDEFKVITVLDISGNKLTDKDGVVVAEIIQVTITTNVVIIFQSDIVNFGIRA